MAKITGLGGVFFNTKGEEKSLLEWYAKTLGLRVTEYGLNMDSNEEILVTFKRSSNNAFINFTVDDLETFMAELKNKNVEVVKEIKDYPYGRFSQIKDLHGNIVELFEVNKEAYYKMVKEELDNYKNKKN